MTDVEALVARGGVLMLVSRADDELDRGVIDRVVMAAGDEVDDVELDLVLGA